MKVLLFGGTSKLGSEIVKQSVVHELIQIYTPTRSECDIRNIREVEKMFGKYKPNIVIKCVALVGTKECEQNKELAWQTNVVGNSHIVRACQKHKVRMVFISTNAVFDGKKGRYKETDIPDPAFFYAITKAVSEQVVSALSNHAVIRLDFFPLSELKYNKIFTDHYTSKIPVDQAARVVIQIAKSNFVGTIHVGQPRKSLYKILKPHHPQIAPIRISESTLPDFPKDLSFDLSKFRKHFPQLDTG